MKMKTILSAAALLSAAVVLWPHGSLAQEKTPAAKDTEAAGGAEGRGSIVEDRAAGKLLDAGDTRLEANETTKAVEIWEAVIERYPRSKVRFTAHMRLGNYLLEKERVFDQARQHFEAILVEANTDGEQRAEALLKVGICFFKARNFNRCFVVMREVIEKFPASPQVNQAYYYIGVGHFQLGHYARAIDALEKVGTTLASGGGHMEKLEAGKRFFVTIDDADLVALRSGRTVKVRCQTTQGDSEAVECFPLGRNASIVLGSLITALGKPVPDNGVLEVRGDDKVQVVYVDEQTGDKKSDQKIIKEIKVVGDGNVAITDGAYDEALQGVVLDKEVHVQIHDTDQDLSNGADPIEILVEVLREKTHDELEAEKAAAIAKDPGTEPKVDQFKKLDELKAKLTEVKVEKQQTQYVGASDEQEAAGDKSAGSSESIVSAPAPTGDKPATAAPAVVDDGSIHSGTFRGVVALARAEEPIAGDKILQAQQGDIIQVTYSDVRNTAGDEAIVLLAKARAMEGNLGGVRVTKIQISDQELRVQTQLKTASALTNIGNRYKEFGLKVNADGKYAQALQICEEVMVDAKKLGGRLLEDTYVQLWKIYFEMENLSLAAAMCQRLQREFPESTFADDALLQLAEVARKQGDLQKAVALYHQLVNSQKSDLRGEAQFGIAECYEAMAKKSANTTAKQVYDRAFEEYKKVFDQFPDCGRVGEAVAKMSNYYYQQQDYARAIDVFETVLKDYPDAKFLDVILYNYGKCLYRMERKSEARRQFDQLMAEFPDSSYAGEAKKITEALAKESKDAQIAN